MPRIRTIKPEFPQSETIGKLTRAARLLFVQLFTIVDDAGRTRAAPRMLASLLYPYDDDAPGLIEGWLDELSVHGAVRRYEVGGAQYLEIAKWLEHQKIDRPSPSRLPSLQRQDESQRPNESLRQDETLYNAHAFHVKPSSARDASRIAPEPAMHTHEPSRRIDADLDSEKDQDRDKDQDQARVARTFDASPPVAASARVRDANAFDEFWQAYPRRDGPNPRRPAEQKFHALIKSGVEAAMLIAAVKRLACEEAAKNNIGTRFIPQAMTWLAQQRWADHAATALAKDTAAPQLAIEDAVKMFAKTRHWSKWAGPEPGMRGCRASPQLLAQYGLSGAGVVAAASATPSSTHDP
jgi:hypothetical protein